MSPGATCRRAPGAAPCAPAARPRDRRTGVSDQRARRGSDLTRSRRMATRIGLPRSSARLSSRWHSLLSSASGEASRMTASHDALALRSVSRQRSPAPMPCRSMKTSSADQPLPNSQRWKASAWTLSMLECEMNKRGIRPTPDGDRSHFTSVGPDRAARKCARGSRHLPQEKKSAARFQIVNQRGVTPEEDEVSLNPRARSARLRWGVRTEA